MERTRELGSRGSQPGVHSRPGRPKPGAFNHGSLCTHAITTVAASAPAGPGVRNHRPQRAQASRPPQPWPARDPQGPALSGGAHRQGSRGLAAGAGARKQSRLAPRQHKGRSGVRGRTQRGDQDSGQSQAALSRSHVVIPSQLGPWSRRDTWGHSGSLGDTRGHSGTLGELCVLR